MLSTILPAYVESAERVGAVSAPELPPEELALVAGAVASRRHEFAVARGCARECLDRLGIPCPPLLRGPGGAPVWPPGVHGSITHCEGYAAAAVGTADLVVALGIDAEPDEPLPPGVLDVVATAAEREHLARLAAVGRAHAPVAPDLSWDRLLFSAKESVYKAWFPATGRWLDHHDVTVVLDPGVDAFSALLPTPGLPVPGGHRREVAGRWTAATGVLVTAVVVPVSEPTRTPRTPGAGC